MAGVVLLVTMIPMGVLLANATSAAAQSRQREAAVQLADSWVEILSNSQPPEQDGAVRSGDLHPDRAPGTQAPSSTLAGTTYTVGRVLRARRRGQRGGLRPLSASGEPPSPSHPDVFELTVRVNWDGKYYVSDSTEVNYPKPGLQTDGFLAINVTNDGETDVHGNTASDRLTSVPVTISSSSLTLPSLTADPNGCIFVQVPPARTR